MSPYTPQETAVCLSAMVGHLNHRYQWKQWLLQHTQLPVYALLTPGLYRKEYIKRKKQEECQRLPSPASQATIRPGPEVCWFVACPFLAQQAVGAIEETHVDAHPLVTQLY